MFKPYAYAQAPLLDTGVERAIFTPQNLPFVDLDWTGEQINRTLSPGARGQIAVLNVALSGLPGQLVPGLYTQPLTPRGQ